MASRTFAPELTFLPRRHPCEITNCAKGDKLIARVNKWLTWLGDKTGVYTIAKLDPHHNAGTDKQTYVVEVVPVPHFNLDWLRQDNVNHQPFMRAMEDLFDGMKGFGLVPNVTRRRGDTDYSYPNGGQHVMISADMFPTSINWFKNMERFHKNLMVDYANRPYIRWLLAHWMGDGGSHVAVTKKDMQDHLFDTQLAYEAAFNSCAIEPRYMSCWKNLYPTYEFRMIGMVDNARQMRAAVLLINAWVDHITTQTEYYSPIRFILTPEKWDAMTKIKTARELCREWVEDILGFDWADYEADFFERNYVVRAKHGKWC